MRGDILALLALPAVGLLVPWPAAWLDSLHLVSLALCFASLVLAWKAKSPLQLELWPPLAVLGEGGRLWLFLAHLLRPHQPGLCVSALSARGMAGLATLALSAGLWLLLLARLRDRLHLPPSPSFSSSPSKIYPLPRSDQQRQLEKLLQKQLEMDGMLQSLLCLMAASAYVKTTGSALCFLVGCWQGQGWERLAFCSGLAQWMLYGDLLLALTVALLNRPKPCRRLPVYLAWVLICVGSLYLTHIGAPWFHLAAGLALWGWFYPLNAANTLAECKTIAIWPLKLKNYLIPPPLSAVLEMPQWFDPLHIRPFQQHWDRELRHQLGHTVPLIIIPSRRPRSFQFTLRRRGVKQESWVGVLSPDRDWESIICSGVRQMLVAMYAWGQTLPPQPSLSWAQRKRLSSLSHSRPAPTLQKAIRFHLPLGLLGPALDSLPASCRSPESLLAALARLQCQHLCQQHAILRVTRLCPSVERQLVVAAAIDREALLLAVLPIRQAMRRPATLLVSSPLKICLRNLLSRDGEVLVVDIHDVRGLPVYEEVTLRSHPTA